MNISIVRGAKAEELMSDSAFIKKWAELEHSCRWATVFQSHNFVDAWYRSYQEKFEPVIVKQTAAGGELLGLLTLAVQRDTERWVAAGDHQSEYQIWLATDSNSETFITDAIRLLRKELKVSKLTFTYIPESVPLQWTQMKNWKKNCLLRPRPRPILDLSDAKKINKSYRKKKNKINRLKRLGPLSFTRITDRNQLSEIISEMETLYDFRMSAAYAVAPFLLDKNKHEFHLAMMEKPDLLHVTVLKVGDKLVAYHIGVFDDETVYSGILAYSPFLARMSPGRLHLLILAKELMENRYLQFDLTPGNDPWKNEVANKFETVFEVTIFSNMWSCKLKWLKQKAMELAWRISLKLGTEPRNVWVVYRLLKPRSLKLALSRLFKKIKPVKNDLEYQLDIDKVNQIKTSSVLQRDNLNNFLANRFAENDGLFNSFLRDASKRMSVGQHPYTAVIDGHLVFCGWLVEETIKKDSNGDQSKQSSRLVTLRDFTVINSLISFSFLEEALSQMIKDAALVQELEEIFIHIPTTGTLWAKVIEGMNQKYSNLFKSVANETFR